MKRLWLAFAAVLVFSFSVLGWVGTRIYQEAPPIPDRVVATNGTLVVPSGDIGKGQNVWQALGGMEVGWVWGHGGYVAPDWSADWLHRECVFILDEWARTDFALGAVALVWFVAGLKTGHSLQSGDGGGSPMRGLKPLV
jgi:nitric oxide reductase subunit B